MMEVDWSLPYLGISSNMMEVDRSLFHLTSDEVISGFCCSAIAALWLKFPIAVAAGVAAALLPFIAVLLGSVERNS